MYRMENISENLTRNTVVSYTLRRIWSTEMLKIELSYSKHLHQNDFSV